MSEENEQIAVSKAAWRRWLEVETLVRPLVEDINDYAEWDGNDLVGYRCIQCSGVLTGKYAQGHSEDCPVRRLREMLDLTPESEDADE